MRLRHLDLIRFGRFTDHRIDFGARPAGKPDLHIVYGPNEAGKSTALAAVLDLFFGIGTQSRFNFLHPYPTMRIGAALDLSGGPQDLVRIKRPQNSLLDGQDRPVSESLLAGEFGGIDRDAYRTMFSLDDDTLEAGGESILASKGDLGQLLFSASAGLAELSRSLVGIRAEAEGFYKYRARAGELADLKARLAVLKDERDRVDMLASHYAQLVDARDRSAADYEAAIRRRGEIQARLDEIRRFLSALPRLAALRALRERLAPLADLPEAPLGWAEALPRLQQEEIELATRARSIGDDIAQCSAEIDGMVVDEAAAGLAGRLERLSGLRARHMTAEKDIPERRIQKRAEELAMSGILARIERQGEPDPARLVLGASVLGALGDLIESRSGLETRLASADRELAGARARLAEARSALERAGGTPAAGPTWQAQLSALVASVATLRAGTHAARHRLAARARPAHLDTLADRLRALRPWTGDPDTLLEMAVPDAGQIERWVSTAAEAERAADRQAADIERLTTEADRLAADRDAIGIGTGIVGDEAASTVRMAREQAWAEHRRALDAASAEVFEAALRHDDVVTSARIGRSADVARLEQTSHAAALVTVDLKRATLKADQALARRQVLDQDIAAALRRMSPALPEDMRLAQLQAWLKHRDKALEARASLVAAEREIAEAEAEADDARRSLSAALAATGLAPDPDAGFDALMAAAQAAIDRESELKALRDAIEDRRRALEARERDAESAAAAERAWAAAWTRACSSCWLGDTQALPEVATVREIIDAVAELRPALERQEGLADRIAKMEKDQALFGLDVTTIAEALGLGTGDVPILDLERSVERAVRTAAAALASRAAKQERLEGLTARARALAEAQSIHAIRKSEMTHFFGVASLADVGGKLQGADRKADLQRQADASARDILDALRLHSVPAAETLLDAADRSALELELIDQQSRFDDQDGRARDLFAQHSKAADQVAAVGGDGAAARIEEQRRTTLLEIEDGALRYLRLRVGAAAAEQALRAYRDRHRSSMMESASRAFRTISRGAYSGLSTQPERDSEILVAIGADGSSKLAADLSKGTRFQLYLALRVAGYHEFARLRSALPFIADDIMETFDDFRAEEAFRLFADMAGVGQVIYLTHHQHLCDIARKVCPGVTIHHLASRSVPAA